MLTKIETEVGEGEVPIFRVEVDSFTMTVWRNLISSIYSHPTIIFHDDLQPLRDMFWNYGAVHETQCKDIIIPMERPPGKTHSLRPPVEAPFSPLPLLFGAIKKCTVTPTEIRVQECSLTNTLKAGMEELIEFIRIYPTGLREEQFGFVYDFLVRFGILPATIDEAILHSARFRLEEALRKQRRRKAEELGETYASTDEEQEEAESSDSDLTVVDKKKTSTDASDDEDEESEDADSEDEKSSESTSSEEDDVYCPSSQKKTFFRGPRDYRPWALRQKTNENRPQTDRRRLRHRTDVKSTQPRLAVSYKLKRSAAAAANARKTRTLTGSSKETVFEFRPLPESCKTCPVSGCSSGKLPFKNRDAVFMHYKYKHSDLAVPAEVDDGVRYPCPHCTVTCKYERLLIIHLQNVHGINVSVPGRRKSMKSGVDAGANEDERSEELDKEDEAPEMDEEEPPENDMQEESEQSESSDEDVHVSDKKTTKPRMMLVTVKRYKCPGCELILVRPEHLRAHVKENHPQAYDQLPRCLPRIKVQEMRKVYPQPIVRLACSHCPNTYTAITSLHRHFNSTHPGQKLVPKKVKAEGPNKVRYVHTRPRSEENEPLSGEEDTLSGLNSAQSEKTLLPEVQKQAEAPEGKKEKPKRRYPCTQCTADFGRADRLMCHLAKAHPVKVNLKRMKPVSPSTGGFSCPHCHTGCTYSPTALTIHLRRFHPNRAQTLPTGEPRILSADPSVSKADSSLPAADPTLPTTAPGTESVSNEPEIPAIISSSPPGLTESALEFPDPLPTVMESIPATSSSPPALLPAISPSVASQTSPDQSQFAVLAPAGSGLASETTATEPDKSQKALKARRSPEVTGTCPVCGRLFPQRYNLFRHFKSLHPELDLASYGIRVPPSYTSAQLKSEPDSVKPEVLPSEPCSPIKPLPMPKLTARPDLTPEKVQSQTTERKSMPVLRRIPELRPATAPEPENNAEQPVREARRQWNTIQLKDCYFCAVCYRIFTLLKSLRHHWATQHSHFPLPTDFMKMGGADAASMVILSVPSTSSTVGTDQVLSHLLSGATTLQMGDCVPTNRLKDLRAVPASQIHGTEIQTLEFTEEDTDCGTTAEVIKEPEPEAKPKAVSAPKVKVAANVNPVPAKKAKKEVEVKVGEVPLEVTPSASPAKVVVVPEKIPLAEPPKAACGKLPENPELAEQFRRRLCDYWKNKKKRLGEEGGVETSPKKPKMSPERVASPAKPSSDVSTVSDLTTNLVTKAQALEQLTISMAELLAKEPEQRSVIEDVGALLAQTIDQVCTAEEKSAAALKRALDKLGRNPKTCRVSLVDFRKNPKVLDKFIHNAGGVSIEVGVTVATKRLGPKMKFTGPLPKNSSGAAVGQAKGKGGGSGKPRALYVPTHIPPAQLRAMAAVKKQPVKQVVKKKPTMMVLSSSSSSSSSSSEAEEEEQEPESTSDEEYRPRSSSRKPAKPTLPVKKAKKLVSSSKDSS